MPTVVSRNSYEISLANFTVLSGENKLSRPFSQVASGALKVAKSVHANLTHNTANNIWFISSGFDLEVL